MNRVQEIIPADSTLPHHVGLCEPFEVQSHPDSAAVFISATTGRGPVPTIREGGAS